MRKYFYAITRPCTGCGHRFVVRDESERTTVTGFTLNSGKTIHLCRECVLKVAQMKTRAELDRFVKRMEARVHE